MILVVDCGSSKVPEIVHCIRTSGHESTVVNIDKLTNENLSSYSHTIVSGSPLLFKDRPYEELIEWGRYLFQAQHKVLGICFGHQWMGLCYGSSISIGKESRTSIPVQWHKDSILNNNLTKSSLMSQDHCEHLKLPDGFVLLADSEDCANEAMMHQQYPHFGVQFHPECSASNGQVLIDNFLRL